MSSQNTLSAQLDNGRATTLEELTALQHSPAFAKQPASGGDDDQREKCPYCQALLVMHTEQELADCQTAARFET